MKREAWLFPGVRYNTREDDACASPGRYTGPGGITWLHRWALTQGKRGDFFQGEPEVDEFVNALYQVKH